MGIRIKDWHKFQHFKDRRPPWVKLYRDLLDDLEWHDLDPAAAKALVMLWLIASEYEGALPEGRVLAFRLRVSEVECNSLILQLSHWLERDDNSAISSGYQADRTEIETEGETETEVEKEPKGSLSPAGDDPPPCPHSEIVALYHELLPANPRIKTWDGTRADSLRTRWREDRKRQTLDYWRRYFAHVAASPFLTGQVEDRNGRPFLPGLDWLVKKANFTKVIENRYHDRRAA